MEIVTTPEKQMENFLMQEIRPYETWEPTNKNVNFNKMSIPGHSFEYCNYAGNFKPTEGNKIFAMKNGKDFVFVFEITPTSVKSLTHVNFLENVELWKQEVRVFDRDLRAYLVVRKTMYD